VKFNLSGERKWLQRLNTDYEKAVATSYLSAPDFLCKHPKEGYILFSHRHTFVSCAMKKLKNKKEDVWVYLTDREIFYYEIKCASLIEEKIHSNIIVAVIKALIRRHLFNIRSNNILTRVWKKIWLILHKVAKSRLCSNLF